MLFLWDEDFGFLGSLFLYRPHVYLPHRGRRACGIRLGGCFAKCPKISCTGSFWAGVLAIEPP